MSPRDICNLLLLPIAVLVMVMVSGGVSHCDSVLITYYLSGFSDAGSLEWCTVACSCSYDLLKHDWCYQQQ